MCARQLTYKKQIDSTSNNWLMQRGELEDNVVCFFLVLPSSIPHINLDIEILLLQMKRERQERCKYVLSVGGM